MKKLIYLVVFVGAILISCDKDSEIVEPIQKESIVREFSKKTQPEVIEVDAISSKIKIVKPPKR